MAVQANELGIVYAGLQKRSDYPLVERSNSTQQTSTQGVLPTTAGANARLKDNQSNSSTNALQKQDSTLESTSLIDKTPLPMERE